MLGFMLILTVCVASRSTMSAQDTAAGVIWGPDVQISLDPASVAGANYTVHLAVQDYTIHATWSGGILRLPYARSTNDGVVWETAKDLLVDTTRFPYVHSWDVLMATPDRVAIVFNGTNGSGISPLYYLRSYDRGDSWLEPEVMTPTDSTGVIDAGAARGDSMAIQYPRGSDNAARGLVRTTNEGQTWTIAPYRMPSFYSQQGSLAFTPGYLLVAHPGDTWPGPAPEVVVHRSTNVGETWSDSTALSPIDGRTSDMAQLASYTDSSGITTIVCVWRDFGLGGGFVGGATAYSISVDNGDTWSPPQVLTEEHNAYRQQIAINEGLVAVAWGSVLGYYEQINVRWSTNRGETWSPVYGVTPDTVRAFDPAIAVTTSAIHVAWQEWRDSLYNIFYRRGELLVTSVRNGDAGQPAAFGLLPNYPNPFNAMTTIRYEVPETGEVTVRVYDIMGREVAALVTERQLPGAHKVVWNAGSAASGAYFCRMFFAGRGNSFVSTRSMLLIR